MSFIGDSHGGAGIKMSNRIKADESDEFLQFLQQMGVEYCYTMVDSGQDDYEFLKELKERTAKYGLSLFNVGHLRFIKPAEVHLALPGRDETIEKFNKFITTLGKVGIPTTTITWEPNKTITTTADGKWVLPWQQDKVTDDTPEATTRGGAVVRLVDMEVVNAAGNSHGRIFTKDEIIENFLYFAKACIPIAEKVKVRICLHPNDPPADSCLGNASLISSYSDYKRIFEMVKSDYFGMEFCVGCWLEGGKEGFGDIIEDIKDSVAAEKVSIVHFRNVSNTMPVFTATFVDDGIGDMRKIMKTFVDSGYNGTLVYDNSPIMQAGGIIGQTAFAVGYNKGLLDAAVGTPKED